MTKQRQEVLSRLCNHLAMLNPGLSSKDSPRPFAIRILVASSRLQAPWIKKEGSQVDEWLVHNITGKVCRKREDPRDPREDVCQGYSLVLTGH